MALDPLTDTRLSLWMLIISTTVQESFDLSDSFTSNYFVSGHNCHDLLCSWDLWDVLKIYAQDIWPFLACNEYKN